MCLIERFASTLSANREEGKTIRMEPEVTLWFEEMSSENSRSKFQVSGGFGVPRFHRRIALPEHHQRGPGSGRSRREARFSDISSAAQEPIWPGSLPASGVRFPRYSAADGCGRVLWTDESQTPVRWRSPARSHRAVQLDRRPSALRFDPSSQVAALP